MSQVQTIIRAELYPNEVGKAFIVSGLGGAPAIYKGACMEFQLAFFQARAQGNNSAALYDVSNIIDVSLSVKPINNPGGSNEILETIDSGDINAALTLQQWTAGTAQHCSIQLDDSQTNIAAGNHAITIWGHLSDGCSIVFGIATLSVIDAGITNTTNPVLADTYLTAAQVAALLAGYVPFIVPAGKLVTFQAEDGYKRIFGAGNDQTRIDEWEAP